MRLARSITVRAAGAIDQSAGTLVPVSPQESVSRIGADGKPSTKLADIGARTQRQSDKLQTCIHFRDLTEGHGGSDKAGEPPKPNPSDMSPHTCPTCSPSIHCADGFVCRHADHRNHSFDQPEYDAQRRDALRRGADEIGRGVTDGHEFQWLRLWGNGQWHFGPEPGKRRQCDGLQRLRAQRDTAAGQGRWEHVLWRLL